ncbi:hypothetical protein ACOME3_005066 [Neoechinorhynchus agilis]
MNAHTVEFNNLKKLLHSIHNNIKLAVTAEECEQVTINFLGVKPGILRIGLRHNPESFKRSTAVSLQEKRIIKCSVNEKPKYIGIKLVNNKLQSVLNRDLRNLDKTIFLFNTKEENLAVILKNKSKCEQYQVVFDVRCKDCLAKYAGQTKQGLSKRIAEHRYACRRYDASSAIANHRVNCEHQIDFDDVNVISVQPNLRNQLIMEAIKIECLVQPMEAKKRASA